MIVKNHKTYSEWNKIEFLYVIYYIARHVITIRTRRKLKSYWNYSSPTNNTAIVLNLVEAIVNIYT